MAKERQIKKMLALTLTMALAAGSMPVTAFAENGESSGVVSGGSDNSGFGNGSDDDSAGSIPAAPVAEEIPVEKNGPINITISIPSTPDDPETEDVDEGTYTTTFGPEAGTATGDLPAVPEDEDYDYEVTTQQGSVTVTTHENEITTEYGEDDLDYVSSDTKPTEDNDLYKDGAAAPEQFQPGYEQPEGEVPAEGETPVEGETPAEGDEYQFGSGDEYQFEYVGTGNTSNYRPAMVFTEPMTEEQKLDKWGDGVYIGTSYSELWVSFLPDPEIAARDDDGNLILKDGFVVDKNGEKIMKAEQRVVGPDGKTYYTHRIDNMGEGIFVEGWYQDGEWKADLNGPAPTDKDGNPAPEKVMLVDKDGNPIHDEAGDPVYADFGKIREWVQVKENGVLVGNAANGNLLKDEDGNVIVNFGAVWASAQQFVLVDKTTGELITVYCADLDTPADEGFGYNIKNLEDAGYYNDEQAEQIRAIAANGYWGTASGEGSLDAMKEMLRASGQFTDEELASLNDGVALTATQMAIWSCSNHMAGTEFINSHYGGGNVPEDKEDEVKLMFRVYEYLKALTPVSYEGKETTADTIINADNFLKDGMEITVLEKTKDHENNQDDDDTNDAYTTNLSFALVVTPSTENGDELVVSVVSNGQVLASGCIAGEKQDMYADENGNYTFKNIVMTEGNQEFNITMEGIQNLKEGVYLYTSEIRNEGTSDEVSSQTFVGMANGDHEVKVSQNINFSFEVEDEKVVVRERHSKKKEQKKTVENPPQEEEFFEEDVPMGDIPEIPEVVVVDEPVIEEVEIGEGDVILSDIPKTGDPSLVWLALSGISGLALAIRKRR